jgi:hypothetical protein
VRDVEAVLDQQVAEGEELEERLQRPRGGAPGARRDAEAWHEENEILLARLFTDHGEYARYRSASTVLRGEGNGPLIALRQRLRFLRSLRRRLEYFETASAVGSRGTRQTPPPPAASCRRVFLVHGHDEGAKLAVSDFLRRVDLEPVVLEREPDGGRFVLEKFEDHADVAFAVALLTPDDPAGEARRARQNVMLELGFFLGRLGRARVRALYKRGVEVPSDMLGWLYIEMDEHGAWKHKLARELAHAGFPLDPDTWLRALQ